MFNVQPATAKPWPIVIATAMLSALVWSGTDAAQSSPDPLTAPAEFSAYDLDVELTPDDGTIAGTMSIDWLNATGEDQESVYLRLFPNADYYSSARTTIQAAAVDGKDVEPQSDNDETVARLDTPEVIANGDRARIELAFETVIPKPAAASFGVFGGSERTGWTLADWYPIVAGWEQGSGWYLDPPTDFGDPTFADAATYDVTLTTPDDLAIVASGSESSASRDEASATQQVEMETGPARDFTITLLPRERQSDIRVHQRDVDGTTVRLTLPAKIEIDGISDFLLDDVTSAFPVYEDMLGDFDEDELDITTAPLADVTGVSWSGLIWLGLATFTSDGVIDDEEREYLRFVVTHELGHQWLAGIVGSNNNDHGFMTEGLTNQVSVLVLRESQGVDYADRVLRYYVAGSYGALLRDERDGIADAPITNDTNVVIRSFLVYGKAAIGFEAIRQEIGNEGYLAGLTAYAMDFRFGVSDPVDLQSAFEDSGGANLDAIWSFWFDADDATTRDLDLVLDGFSRNQPVHR